MSLTLTSKRIVTPGGIVDGYVIINGGVIQVVGSGKPAEESTTIMDVGNSVVMPGIIDPHVHINEPGRTAWEGFDTGTRAAIAGGVTTLVDMPLNAFPVTTTKEALNEKRQAARHQLHCHCGYWGGVVPGNTAELQGLIDAGVLGFKAFMTHSGIDEFPNVSEDDLRLAMPIIAAAGLPLLVHCELTDNEQRAIGDVRTYKNYLSSRPAKWEDEAVALMIRLCREYACRVHIVHLSSASSIKQIEAAKREGLPLTVETGQHYLYFNAENIPDGETAFKCAPPIREANNNEQLWEALKAGTIDFVATDHSPAPPELKELETGNFMKAWGGIASLQFALPALWTAARQRNIGLIEMAKWLCEGPALFTGLNSTKGQLSSGYDADIVIWNPEAHFEVVPSIIHHKHKITPYLHQILYGVVEHTFVRGHHVLQTGFLKQLNKGAEILK